MSDSTISALTGASTPLAGTEVLPIVQSGSTVKVSVANLTAGRAVSATAVTASTGNLIVSTSGKGVTTDSAIPLGFGTNTTTAAMTIATSGNVGIGTSSPNEKLTVSGNISATGNVIADGQFLFSDGTVSAPSIANNGDSNNGIYFPAADTLGFVTGGVETHFHS
jgi:hypothetical protein